MIAADPDCTELYEATLATRTRSFEIKTVLVSNEPDPRQLIGLWVDRDVVEYFRLWENPGKTGSMPSCVGQSSERKKAKNAIVLSAPATSY